MPFCPIDNHLLISYISQKFLSKTKQIQIYIFFSLTPKMPYSTYCVHLSPYLLAIPMYTWWISPATAVSSPVFGPDHHPRVPQRTHHCILIFILMPEFRLKAASDTFSSYGQPIHSASKYFRNYVPCAMLGSGNTW